MARIYAFPYHLLHGVDVPCTACPGDPSCYVCDGGLSLCTVCGGAEGAMPTDCPGYQMEAVVSDEVYAGALDYDRREGWVRRSSNLATFIKRG